MAEAPVSKGCLFMYSIINKVGQGGIFMDAEKLERALQIAEKYLPDSELSKELKKTHKQKSEQQEMKKYIKMITQNEFSSREEIENLDVPFKDDLLFFYDMGNFKPTDQEKEKVRELTELLDLLDGERFMAEKREVEQEIEIYKFKERLSMQSWDEVVDTTSADAIEKYPKFRKIFRQFDALLDLVR